MGFCYQQNTHFSQATKCGREEFWGSVRNTSNQWKIDSRRAILEAVEKHDEKAIKQWVKDTDYQKFLAKKRGLKNSSARQKFFEKSDEERLLAFAQELKDNLTAFIFSCREFDATPTANGKPFCHRRLADCHLNGLVMLDIDHVENPLAVFEAWKAHDELVKRTALVHITSSKKGIRFVFTAKLKDGNLADQQIVFSEKLGYTCDQSTIDATRNSFAPKEEDILYINEDLLFDYYDEEFDRKYTPLYRDKKTQPLYHQFKETHPQQTQSRPLPEREGSDYSQGQELSAPSLQGGQGEGLLLWHGIPVQSIIDARYRDKLPCAADSNRHNESLKLATDLLIMLDGDKQQVQRIVEAQPWVKEIIDERDENVGQTVASAAECVAQKEKKYGPDLKPSKAMQEAIATISDGKSTQKEPHSMLNSKH